MSKPSGTPCKVKCIGGNDCICNDVPKHPHTLHTCNVAGCACHTAAYHMERVHDDSGREFYVPTGTRLAPRKRGGE